MNDSEKELAKSQLGMLARKAMLFVAGVLVTKAGVDVLPFLQPLLNQTTEVLGGLVLSGLGTVWAFRKHLHWNRKVEVAREAPQGTARVAIEYAKLRRQRASLFSPAFLIGF